MTQYERIDDALTALEGSGTVEQIEYALRDFGDREVRAVLASRAGEGAGSLTVSDGSTTVTDVTTLDLTGHTVSEVSPGVAEANVSVPVLSTRVPLTDAQIKALPTTPVELVPAPGVGKTILVVGAFVVVDTAENGYDNFDVTASLLITFAGEGPGAAQGLLAASGMEDLFSAFTIYTILLAPYTVPVALASSAPNLMDAADIENKALVIRVENGALGDFIDGDPLNSGSVTTLYMIVDL